MIKNAPLETVWTAIAQDASDMMWVAAPWTWTISTLAPITLSAGSQYFTVSAPPSDFQRFEKCYNSNGTYIEELTPVSVPPNSPTQPIRPKFVAYVPGSPTRIYFETLFPNIPTGETWKFFSWYKQSA